MSNHNCIFCKIASGEFNSYKVYEDDHTLAFLDINPKAEYHTLVIPKAHHANVLDIPMDIFAHVTETVKKVVDLYREKLGMENVQLIHNAGEYAQQDVFHLHFHIVPRADSDGCNLKWPPTRTALKEKFDELLAKLT